MNVHLMACMVAACVGTTALGWTSPADSPARIDFERLFRDKYGDHSNDVEIDRWQAGRAVYQGPLRWLWRLHGFVDTRPYPLALSANDRALMPADDRVQIDLDDRRLLGRVHATHHEWRRLTRELVFSPFSPVSTVCWKFTPMRKSDAPAGSPHGGKVYDLYVLRPTAYLERVMESAAATDARLREDLASGRQSRVRREVYGDKNPDLGLTPGASMPAAVKQVLMLDAHEPVEIGTTDVASLSTFAPLRRMKIVATDGPRFFMPAQPIGQFVMIEFDESRADTDDGWLYATINARGEISSFGRIESCMQCHQRSASGRVLTSKIESRLVGFAWTSGPRESDLTEVQLHYVDMLNRMDALQTKKRLPNSIRIPESDIVPVVPPLLPGIVP